MRHGIVIVALSFAIPARAHADCPPAAVASGDPVLVQRISERLAASGIETRLIEGCPVVQVFVEQRGEQVHLRVTDTFARLGQRQVHDVATAAAIVESWTRQEIEAGSFPELARTAEPAVVLAAPSRRRLARTGIAAMFESSLADEGSIWLGGAVAGCGRIGPLCVGGLVRGARDTNASGRTDGSEHTSDELHALVTLELPARIAGFGISPGVGVGYGWLAISTTHLDMHMMEVETQLSSHALRADVHVTITRWLGRSLSLFGDFRGDAALARSDVPTGPKAFVRLGLGIRVEVP